MWNLGANLKLAIQAIVQDEVVCHPYAVRLHWVSLAIVEVPHLAVVEIGNLVSRKRRGRGARWVSHLNT